MRQHFRRSIRRIHHRVTTVRTIASSRVMRTFAEHMGMVYFGNVNQQDDEHKIVRGITASVDHLDRHYVIGTIDTYDCVLLQRTDSLRSPHTADETHITWMVLQIDLKTANGLPRTLLVSHAHQPIFVSNALLKDPRLSEVESAPGNHLLFVDRAATVASLSIHTNETLVNDIARHCHGYDIEIDDDSIYIYVSNSIVSRQSLESQTRAGIWLARALDEASM